jgi:putative Ca2+/H+ antiporter (TMEM165/GDT1 family)
MLTGIRSNVLRKMSQNDTTFVRSSVDAFLNSFLLVFAGEMGDKTQLLSLVLVTRFKKPWTILLGVFIATILNHSLASWAGASVASIIEPRTMSWILAVIFFAFGLWILVPDKEEELKESSSRGILFTTVVAFFLAEMGDKTQLATIALGASYTNTVLVTLGSTLGMMASNALAIFLGERMLKRIPMKLVRIAACILFMLFAIAILAGTS